MNKFLHAFLRRLLIVYSNDLRLTYNFHVARFHHDTTRLPEFAQTGRNHNT